MAGCRHEDVVCQSAFLWHKVGGFEASNSYGLYSYGLYSHGLYSYGLYSYGPSSSSIADLSGIDYEMAVSYLSLHPNQQEKARLRTIGPPSVSGLYAHVIHGRCL